MKQFIAICAIGSSIAFAVHAAEQPALSAHAAKTLASDGLSFKDLNRNGKLDPYEDWRLPAAERAADLVKQMTLEEKAGLMMHGTAPSVGAGAGMGVGSEYDLDRARDMIDRRKVVTFITRLGGDPAVLAGENNKLQEIAEAGRLGIPATISTDPRNHFQFVLGASVSSGGFSKWPETLGFAAIGDAALVRRFGDIARQEYRAVGIQEALSPQIDLASEPRWPRINGTFGEDAQIAKTMAEAYVAGFQNGEDGINRDSVIAVAKHWVGYGAAKDGYDSHNAYGRHATFPGNDFAEHLIPFEGAFKAKVGGVMPTYSILDGVTIDGKPLEPVGAGYSKQLLTDLLRGHYGFDGVVLSDWLISNDCKDACLDGEKPGVKPTLNEETFGMPWGVEDLSRVDRFAKAVNAGVDQFGGVTSSDLLVKAVKEKKISEQRLDQSATRILIQKFEQGLFENPYVDPQQARTIVGNPTFAAAATAAQARAMVLLDNKAKLLPVKDGKKVFLYGVDPKVASARGFMIVATAREADFALVRLNAPYQQPHMNYFFGSRHQEGDLDFKDGNADFEAFKSAAEAVPTIVTVYLARPAILTGIRDQASAILGNFGASDEALFDVIEGKQKAEGKLPFELPSSMTEVLAQKPDVPHDTLHPLYPIGYGLAY
ncbi:glycoside hydrolase family 3 protein [Agrobacterium rhizogenes]|uniref:glycoside hydrolase family 3 protein n=1 Tax=Rhizobium rhizogenes TaxID=359 RepID=UPI0008100F11|nr:glycoside hydrolase family 3 N-terminal domain-containing protein [Rhizobium rhizogenes]OCJ19217.1 beta-glucosidase [Agrobacterium sp. B133/95]NTF85229.1 glycoside hydrolase family 3 protein [Rhizobium rhizogenes]NTI52595.1 glycoside hydrolase family 3 protein [Rhizobium rhizogenes]NTI97968.1 glycoside hydrolase family 3 protein [Rhizobium rhizogenes]NTJ60358.1 glycoside hydrolase family 3 protein [Rhizobium rhizogenes]